MPPDIEQFLHLYHKQLETVLDGHMKQMILYGSYARGDFKRNSDSDVMILLDLDDSALRSCKRQICDVTYDFNLEHETDIMPVVQKISHFVTVQYLHSYVQKSI